MNINDPGTGRGVPIPFTKHKGTTGPSNQRLPFAKLIPDAFRNHFIAMCGEFVGTVLFLFFALSGTQVAQNVKSSSGLTVAETGDTPQQLQYIALCFGFSLAVNAWVFFRISGGLFNPAVTVGMCLIGALPWIRGVLLFFVQIVGGIVAAALVSCMFPGALNVGTSLNGDTTVVQGLFIEMFLTAELVFTIFMLAAEKHKGTFIAPVGIGLALFVAELTGVYFTGGSLNPARSFGPAVLLHSFDSYHWIYWLGPILGSVVAAGFYKFIKILEYETANPGQDLDHDLDDEAVLQQRKDLLIAAGINHVDAHQVAAELHRAEADLALDHQLSVRRSADADDEKRTGATPAMANGHGRPAPLDGPDGPMYGTQFRAQRPAATSSASGSQVGRYSYLGRAGRNGSYAAAPPPPAVVLASARANLDSPAMATNEQIYAPLADDSAVRLGGLVSGDPADARARVGRTNSQIV